MKKFKPFADVTKTISTDIFKRVMQFAIVEGGRLISTDGHLLSVINLTQYITEPDQLENVEGKIFDAATCKKIAAADHLTFLENEIVIKKGKDTARIFYPGIISEAGDIQEIDAATGELQTALTGRYPNWRAVVPNYKNNTFNFSELKPGPIGFGASKIAAAAAALNSEFLYFFTSEPNRPGLIFTAREMPTENNKTALKIDFESFVLIMPVINEELKSFHKGPAAPGEALTAAENRAARYQRKSEALAAEIEALNDKIKAMTAAAIQPDQPAPAAILAAAEIEPAGILDQSAPAADPGTGKKGPKKKKEAAAVTAFYKTVNSYKRKRAAGIVKA